MIRGWATLRQITTLLYAGDNMHFDMTDPDGLKRFARKVEDRVTHFARIAMVEAFRRITIKTPVDTGNARWNWWCSIGTIDYNYDLHNSLVIDYGRANQAFIRVKAGDTLYLANSTPYIKRLNEGWSKQAPARFVEMTVEGVENDVKKYAEQAIRENP